MNNLYFHLANFKVMLKLLLICTTDHFIYDQLWREGRMQMDFWKNGAYRASGNIRIVIDKIYFTFSLLLEIKVIQICISGSVLVLVFTYTYYAKLRTLIVINIWFVPESLLLFSSPLFYCVGSIILLVPNFFFSCIIFLHFSKERGKKQKKKEKIGFTKKRYFCLPFIISHSLCPAHL